MLEVREFSDLRQRIIEGIMDMKNGTDKTTPQPDCARAALRSYNEQLPHLELNAGVASRMKALSEVKAFADGKLAGGMK
jgi:hypothetical protein